ncbi:type II secretion system F family protein [Candidatus Woesearchaeota archaeon]|nr:type II secretion system F family protein [Candidatus Woesearchaeota archaeon]
MAGTFARMMERAGVTVERQRLATQVFLFAVTLNTLVSFYLLYLFARSGGVTAGYVLLVIALVWLVLFFIVLFVSWLLLYAVVDLRAFNRRRSIEEVLPDYLQLTAANIRAGMAPDKALWYAVRPKFGVLAKEIEVVAKETMTGSSLSAALRRFADKYDSLLLHRSVDLLVQGMDAGGELGDVLTKVANNIKETRTLSKEMAANITTYVIFIGAAVIVAAPLLLALSHQLLIVLGSVTASLQMPAQGGMFSMSSVAIKPSDFRLFAVAILIITNVCSAMMIASIKKGTVAEGLKYIPMFVVSSLLVFYLSLSTFGRLLGGLFL